MSQADHGPDGFPGGFFRTTDSAQRFSLFTADPICLLKIRWTRAMTLYHGEGHQACLPDRAKASSVGERAGTLSWIFLQEGRPKIKGLSPQKLDGGVGGHRRVRQRWK